MLVVTGTGLFLAQAGNYSEAMPHLPGSMTARQFAKMVKQAHASPMMTARARRVLVDGERVQDVANSDGVDREQIYKAIRKVCPPR